MANSDKNSITRHLPDDLQSSEVVRALLSDPLPTVMAMITSALASGRKEIVFAGGRVVQSILRGRALKQLAYELDDMLKRGKIREDYADTKYGFQSIVDLMTMIDSESPDEDKLQAAKAMFVALNSPEVSNGEAFLRYQLFRVVLKLSGSQLVVLGICYKLHKGKAFNENTARTAQNWLNAIANQIGHHVLGLIEQDETALIQHGMITPRLQADRSGASLENARLSDLGLKICELVEGYSGAIPKPDGNAHAAAAFFRKNA